MLQLAQSFHLLATSIFVVGSAVVGVRLLLLARRTRELPELLLGCAILGTAVLGYGVLIVGLILRGGRLDAEDVPFAAVVLTGIGRSLHNVGVTFFFLFILKVFRSGQTWAWLVAGVALLVHWGGFAWGAAAGSFRLEVVGSVAWLCEYVVVWAYPLWLALESFRYWSLMRRRKALGFADPMVTNRFALWGTGSLWSALAIWTASVPFFLVDQPEVWASVAPVIHIATAAAGLASITCSYLAFLPPAWYARRIQTAA